MEKAIDLVAAKAIQHRYNWRGETESYWLQRLMQEVGELASVMAGDHTDTIEHELTQIASICVNWLDMRYNTSVLQEAMAAIAEQDKQGKP